MVGPHGVSLQRPYNAPRVVERRAGSATPLMTQTAMRALPVFPKAMYALACHESGACLHRLNQTYPRTSCLMVVAGGGGRLPSCLALRLHKMR
jgi:hypothetical protein